MSPETEDDEKKKIDKRISVEAGGHVMLAPPHARAKAQKIREHQCSRDTQPSRASESPAHAPHLDEAGHPVATAPPSVSRSGIPQPGHTPDTNNQHGARPRQATPMLSHSLRMRTSAYSTQSSLRGTRTDHVSHRIFLPHLWRQGSAPPVAQRPQGPGRPCHTISHSDD